jgi:hypothetical protein
MFFAQIPFIALMGVMIGLTCVVRPLWVRLVCGAISALLFMAAVVVGVMVAGVP